MENIHSFLKPVDFVVVLIYLVVLIAMAVWGFVLGPIGALLSVPLTLALRTLLMANGLAWVEPLLSDRPVVIAPRPVVACALPDAPMAEVAATLPTASSR